MNDLEKLQLEFEILKKEYDELKNINSCLTNKNVNLASENALLKDSNIHLKEKNNSANNHIKTLVNSAKELKETVMFLANENLHISTKLTKQVEISNTDILTNLYNRRGMYNKLIANRGCIYTLVDCDLDNFKNINDTFGHHVGDLVLKKIATIFKENTMRANHDFAVRSGGDEFQLFFKTEDVVSIEKRVKIIMEDINKFITVLYDESKVCVEPSNRLSLSAGIASYSSYEDIQRYNKFKTNNLDNDNVNFTDLNDTLLITDKLLYENKRNGKNKVTTYNGYSLKK